MTNNPNATTSSSGAPQPFHLGEMGILNLGDAALLRQQLAKRPKPTREFFDAEWARCAQWLESSLPFGGNAYHLEDIKERVLTDDLTWFWPGHASAAVSEILVFPRFRQLHFWLCGGNLDEIVTKMLPVAEAWGVLAGCSRFSTSGRMGWRRVLAPSGYRPAYEVCIKDLVIP